MLDVRMPEETVPDTDGSRPMRAYRGWLGGASSVSKGNRNGEPVAPQDPPKGGVPFARVRGGR